MTKPELMTIIRLYRVGDTTLEEVRDAVDAYSSASNIGNNLLAGSCRYYEQDNTTAMNCKYCGKGKWMHENINSLFNPNNSIQQ